MLNRPIRPAILGRAHSRIYVTQQDLQAARTRTPLARVLGLAHKEALTPHARDVHSVRRNAVGSAN